MDAPPPPLFNSTRFIDMTGVILGVKGCPLTVESNLLPWVTKMGGTPTYHEEDADHPDVLLIKEQIGPLLSCNSCGLRMFLLIQCYSPIDLADERMVYLFACNNSNCSTKPSESWRCVSVCYSLLAGTRGKEESDDDVEVQERVLGREQLSLYSFPPVLLDIVPEPNKAEDIEPTAVESQMIAEYERRELALKCKMRSAAADGLPLDDADEPEDNVGRDLEDLEHQLDLKNKPTDILFDKYRRRIGRIPYQVLRYHRGGTPLFMNPPKLATQNIPPCRNCGAARTFEFQVLSSILYFLRTSDYVPLPGSCGDGLDFATASVYVCSKQCGAVDDKAFSLCEEFVLVEMAPTMEDDADSKPSLREFLYGDTPLVEHGAS